MNEVASVITAVAVLVTAVGTYLNGRVINKVDKTVKVINKEVKTMNSQTIAQLADADETRRIDLIPPKDRTQLEKSHLNEAGEPEVIE